MKSFIAIGFVAGAVVGSIATYVVTINANSNSTSNSSAVATAPACTANEIALAISQTPALCTPKSVLPVSIDLEQPTDDEASLAFRKRQGAVSDWQSELKIGTCQKGGLASHITCGVEVDWTGKGENSEQRSVGFTKSANGWIAVLY